MGALALVALPALVGALLLAGALPGPAASTPAAAQPAAGEPTPQTDASVPAAGVTMIGATPEEPGAPGRYETWGVGRRGGGSNHVLVRYYVHPAPAGGEAGSWTLGPALPTGFAPLSENPLEGELTAGGAGALAGAIAKRQVLLVRGPGGAFVPTAPVSVEGEELQQGEEPLLKTDEALYGSKRAPLIAALEEAGGGAGALVVPVDTAPSAGVEGQVLHWDGTRWTREPIDVPAKSKEEFRVLAIGASSPQNAWLLAQLASGPSYPAGAVALFRRVPEGTGSWVWKPVALGAGPGEEADPLSIPVQGGETEPFTVAGAGEAPTVTAQLLTVTSAGVWIDGERADIKRGVVEAPASATLFFKPEGGEAAGRVQASWCWLPPSVPTGTPPCDHPLPESLPTKFDRSFAWASPGQEFGTRVITGLPEGVSLSLEGDSFARVLSLGEGGGQKGAAFSTPTEGWLGVESGLPTHLTEQPAASRLTPWPVPFRHPLLAIAPQPGAPVGSLASEALAVGTQGAVARYKPGEGWLPESLFGPGERPETNVQLRAVAWPTPSRAYAVGNEGQMWLWRREIGLWEKDPATPQNFRDNLLGVAFDPNDPARGYAVGTTAVGEGGVLLRYGKTWTEETALPPQAQGAAFTAIAFAGSEAIVTYQKRVSAGSNQFTGGLLVNDGSGWRVDEGAAAAMGSGLPAAVAGLLDGGAAFATEGGAEGRSVYEREAPGAPWQAAPPLRSAGGAGSLALYREGGVLRAIVAAGGVSSQEAPLPAPPGYPPELFPPLDLLSGGVENDGVLRQTASGWSDEGHELDATGPPAPPANYVSWDTPYRPDPILAVLIDPTGAQGWAVGGVDEPLDERLDTADVERYPADGVRPTGAGEATVPVYPEKDAAHPRPEHEYATFAVGGNAECVAPCAARTPSRVGPQVWLEAALALARRIGAPSFLYTGPSVTAGKVEGPRGLPIPFAGELERDASIFAGAQNVHVAVAPQDRDARPEREGTEALFQEKLAPFLGPSRPSCEHEECGAAYALDEQGVRVIVLDESGEVGPEQLGWLEGELQGAKSAGEPAIVVGHGDLNAALATGAVWATELARVLVTGTRASADPCATKAGCASASAYFYDSPEENVTKPLRIDGEQIETFGSGTLGYVNVLNEGYGNFHGASAILLGQVELVARAAQTNRAPVSVHLIPVIGELALEAKGGTLLRRSESALFDGLARRPRAGNLGEKSLGDNAPLQVDQYIPIPEECIGECGTGLFPEYTFSSSNTDVGQFVEHNRAAANDPLAVLQNAKGEAIPDEPEAGKPLAEPQSGLFCAYNAGTTTVTISAGGLSYSLPVTVQAGSVRQPCGTVRLHNLPPAVAEAQIPPPAPAPAPVGPTPASSPPPPVPLPPPPAPAPPPVPTPVPVRQPPPPPSFFVPPIATVAVAAFVPPPLPPAANPTPPSGTSAVTSPVEAAQKEEEEEEATESVSNQALAYRASEHEPAPAYVLGIVVLAAFAGASARRRPRRGRREVRVAPATLSGARSQRRMAGGRRPPR
jgi:hypothetical protein